MNTLFIHTNYKQLFGAKLGKYSFEKAAGPDRKFNVQLIVAEELPEMKAFEGANYYPNPGELRTFGFDNLQSFTITRFKAPELMGYSGRAIVIDPDIFALPGTDLSELFATDLHGADLGCVKRSNGNWESSVMLLECANLTHWKLADMLAQLKAQTCTQQDFMQLKRETKCEIPGYWNSLDSLEGAKVLHTTKRLTQPWKTGLKIDFTQKPLPKIFGIIPREPIYKLLGRYPTHYLPHPKKEIVDFFFMLTKEALQDGVISKEDIQKEINAKHVRPDMFEMLAKY